MDELDDVASYKAISALYNVVEMICVDIMGSMIPPGAKVVSAQDLVDMANKHKKEKDLGDDLPMTDKQKERISELQANSYL